MKRQYFGTDGVRGPVGGPLINEVFARRLGAAAGRFARAGGAAAGAETVIGRDPRASGPALLQALAGGLADAGLVPVDLGVLPTPAVSLAVREMGAAFGAVITASHNPARDNGIKFFGPGGIKLTDDEECALEQLLPAAPGGGLAPTLQSSPRGLDAYLARVQRVLPPGALRGWQIVLDTANGATCVTSRQALAALGAQLELVGNDPDGANINAGVGSEHAETMCNRVRTAGARLGIAHDGDGDRCVLCDETGDVLDGDELLTVLATHALRQGRLALNTLVITVQSNLGVDAAVASLGGRVCRTAVGDRYVIERMRAEGATLGGESSGHVVCSEVSPTGDGLVAALKVIEVMLATGRPLSVLRRALTKFPQLTAALNVRAKRPLEECPALRAAIAAVETELGNRGRVLVRYSGTEPKLRLLVEGADRAQVEAGLDRLLVAARRELEVIED